MNSEQMAVGAFMRRMGQDTPPYPVVPPRPVRELRVELIREELDELANAVSLECAADAIADLLYVVYGTAVAWGIDIAPCFREVHRSNMEKAPSGVVRYAPNGKVLKPGNWKPPELLPILANQGELVY